MPWVQISRPKMFQVATSFVPSEYQATTTRAHRPAMPHRTSPSATVARLSRSRTARPTARMNAINRGRVSGASGRSATSARSGLVGFAGKCVNLMNDAKRGVCIAQANGWRAPRRDRRRESFQLHTPGMIFSGVLPDGRLGRSHGRLHLVVAQRLDAVAAAQSLDLELGIAPEDLEREGVLPLGPGRVQPGHLSARGPQQQEPVVLDRHVPEERSDVTLDVNEVAQEPA